MDIFKAKPQEGQAWVDDEHGGGTAVQTPDPPRRQGHVQQAIAELVRDIPRGTHLTAPEVYRRAREIGLQVSLSTVYRTLHTLQAHGNVTTVSGDRGLRYEAAGSG